MVKFVRYDEVSIYIEVVFHIFNFYRGEQNRSLYRGLHYIEVHYIEVPLYSYALIGVIHFEPLLSLSSLNPKVHYLHTLTPHFLEYLFSSKPAEISF